MGYMGFGMRKVDYTRKPKKAFNRIKAFIIPKSKEGNGAGLKASKAYQEIRFKPAYKRVWFWLLALTLTTAATVFYVDQGSWHVQRQEKAFKAFEREGIYKYYEKHEKTVALIADYLVARQGKITQLGRSSNGSFEITIHSLNHPRHNISFFDHHVGHRLYSEYLQPEVIDGKLRYHINSFQRVLDDYWSCTIELEYIKDLNTTFIEYLNTDYQELEKVISSVAKSGFSVRWQDYGITLKLNPNSSTYAFLVSKEPLDSLVRYYETTPVKIAEGVYWTK